jgi:membrane-associated protease RseP (regulator of RpoE activity)
VSLDDSSGKVVVRNVTPDSPAAKAGIQANDQITSVNGQAVTTASQASTILRGLQSGATVQIGLIRNGAASTVSATLGTAPQPGNQQQRPQIKLPKVLQDLLNQTQQQRQEGDRGGTKSFLDSSGKLVTIQTIPAVVQSVDAANNRLSVTPNGGTPTNIRVDADTVYRGFNGVADLKQGDRVEIKVVQSANDLAISIAKGGQGGFPMKDGPGVPGIQGGPGVPGIQGGPGVPGIQGGPGAPGMQRGPRPGGGNNANPGGNPTPSPTPTR